VSQILIRFDPEADALYVVFADRQPGDVARTEEIGDGRQVDYDAGGALLGVEFRGVSQGVNLADVPRADEVSAALKAFPTLTAA